MLYRPRNVSWSGRHLISDDAPTKMALSALGGDKIFSFLGHIYCSVYIYNVYYILFHVYEIEDY